MTTKNIASSRPPDIQRSRWPFEFRDYFTILSPILRDHYFPLDIIAQKVIILFPKLKSLGSSYIHWVFPKCFCWIQWQKICVIKRAWTCHILYKRSRCYHSASKTQDLSIESNSCFSDLSDSLNLLKLLNSMKFLFHLGKTPNTSAKAIAMNTSSSEAF